MKREQLAINSVSTAWPGLYAALDAYRKAGFRNVELPLNHLKGEMEKGKKVCDLKAAFDSRGMKCIGGFETELKCFGTPEQMVVNLATIVANARLLGEMGAGALVVGTDGPAEKVADPVGTIAKRVATAASIVKGTGVSILLEFNWSPVIKSLRTAVEAARRSGARNTGVIFDTAHYHCTPTKFDQLNRENVKWVKHVHLNDMRDKPGELSNCNADRVLPGKGILDLKAIIARLEECGYKGLFAIELFNEELWKMPVGKSAPLMMKSLLPYCGGKSRRR